MADTLHILNGDSTRQILDAAGLAGDRCVWPDVLSDGPTVLEVGSDAYWQTRRAYMTQAFDVTAAAFDEKAMGAFEQMSRLADYQEVVLWFEYDLFCQINLITLMHWLKGQDRGETKISLICVGREEGYEDLVALGELPPEKYPELFERRRIMGTYDFTFASDAYEAWCSSDPTDLDNFILLSSNEFPYLSEVLRAHQRRFPSTQTGLTEIEEKIVEMVRSGIHSSRKIVGGLLRWQAHYGFGDLQYFQILDRLAPLFESGEILSLKPEVEAALKQQKPIEMIDRGYFLGGAKANEWQWDVNTNELIPREISSL